MASKQCCDNPNIQEDDCGTQDVLVCRSCGQTIPRDQPLDYSEVQQIGEQVSDTYKRPIKPGRLLYRKRCRNMCKKACEELSLSSEDKKCIRLVEEAVKNMQGISLKACIYGVAYLLGRKLRYNLTLKQVARISGIAYDKVGQAVLRLKAVYEELQDDEEDETTVYEQRAQKLLEQMEVGKTDEERVLIVKKCSKVFQIMNMLRKYLTVNGGNNFTLAVTIIGIESYTKKHIPASKMRAYSFKTNGVQSNEIATLVFDMKKELYEIAKCIPWIRQKLDENPKAYRTKVWTMFKFIDTIFTYRRLYIIKETVDLEYSYPHYLFKTSLQECRRRQIILERLQKEMGCEPPPVDNNSSYYWPYFTNRKQREKLSQKQQQQQGSCDDEEEAIVELITGEEHAIIPDDEIMCEDMWCCDTTQDISQDTSTTDQDQDVIENPQYIIHNTSSCDLQDTHHTQDTSQDIIENPQYIIHDTSSCDLQDTNQELSDAEVEDCIRQLIQRGVSTERILTGDLKDMLAGNFIHFLPSCSSLQKDGGSVELTTDDMTDDELLSYIRTEDEISAIASHDPLNDQGPSSSDT